MIANFFNKTKPIHAIIISALFLVYYILAIFIVEKPLFSVGLVLQKIGGLLLFLITFFLIRFINRKNNLSGLNSYVMLVLAILFGVFPHAFEVKQVFYSHFFLLLAFRRIYSIKTNKNTKSKIFDSALWIGIATIFYNWSVLFFPLIFIAIIVFRKQSVRNFIIPIVGFFTPIFIVFTYYYFIDSINGTFYQLFLFEYSFSFINVMLNNKLWVSLLILVLFLTGAIILINIKMNSLANSLKPSWILIVSHLSISTLIYIVAQVKDSSVLLLLFFPATIIITNFLEALPNKKAKEFFVIGLLLLSFSQYLL